MPDLDRIYAETRCANWIYRMSPGAAQYIFEANILSWGFIHV